MNRLSGLFSRVCLPVLVAVVFNLNAQAAAAAEIRMLGGTGPLRAVLVALAEQFQRETGHVVTLENLPGPEVTRILGSDEPADIYLGSTAAVDALVKDGKGGTGRALVGRLGIGIMVRKGAPVPAVATAAEIKAAVLAASGVAYNTAPSGQYVQKMFEQMGIADQIKDKSVRPPNGAKTMERMVSGTGAEIGFGLRNEMTPYLDQGLQFVAMLPSDLQNYNSFEGIVLARSKSADAAAAFLRFISGPTGRASFAKVGID